MNEYHESVVWAVAINITIVVFTICVTVYEIKALNYQNQTETKMSIDQESE